MLRSEIVLSFRFSTPTDGKYYILSPIIITYYIKWLGSDLVIPMDVTLGPGVMNETIINVEINDDTDFEGVESFVLELNLTGGETHRLNVIRPNTSINIFDDDGGFQIL